MMGADQGADGRAHRAVKDGGRGGWAQRAVADDGRGGWATTSFLASVDGGRRTADGGEDEDADLDFQF